MNQQRILQHLREELAQTKQELNNYRHLYRNERNDRREQEARANALQIENVQIEEDKDEIQDQLQQCRTHIDAFKIRKGYKTWGELKSSTSRAKRKSQFRRCLDQSMLHLHEVKRARVQLRVAKEDIVLVWAQNHFRYLRNRARNILNPPPQNNIQRRAPTIDDADPEEVDSENDDAIPNSETEPDAFLSDGTWNDVHIKRIVHVLDMFRISHEAYHELRMTSRSILPPLHLIKKIKTAMSTEISCYYHATVRKISNFLVKLNKFMNEMRAYI